MAARFLSDKLRWLPALSGLIALTMFAYANAAEARDRNLLIAGFQDIVVEGDILVNLVTGKAPSAMASGDRDAIDNLRLSQSGNTLTLLQKTTSNQYGTAKNSAPLSINITNRSVRSIIIRGNGQLRINDMRQTGAGRIRVLGNGLVAIDTVTAGTLDVSIFGNGSVELGKGNVRDARVSIEGNGRYLAADMQSRNFVLTQNGAAETKANVTDLAEISNNGAGSVNITGKGKCTITRKGTGTINCAQFQKGQ